MEESFILNEYCKITIPVQGYLNAEERKWYIDRKNKENRKIEEEAKRNKK